MDTTALVSLIIVTLLAAVVPLAMVFLSRMLGPHRPTEEKGSVYECGIAPEVDAKRRFSVKFYQVAVLFVVFDVEVAFLFPWAVLFRSQEGMTFLLDMVVFLLILSAGLYYVIRRGALEWE